MNCIELNNETPVMGGLGDFLEPVHFHKVDETPEESLWDQLVREHHYLGYDSVIGGRVKYLVTLGTTLVGAISFCSAAFSLGLRDQYVGWDENTRLKYLPHLINNNRFLILPWIRVKNLASHILALSLREVRADWKKQYDVEPYMCETFVDREKFTGTCYIAANWTYLGTTKGFGKIGKSFVFHGREKDLYVYVMNRCFKKIFHPDIDRLHKDKKELLKMMNGLPMHEDGILDRLGVTKMDGEAFNKLLLEHVYPYFRFLGRSENIEHMLLIIKGLLSDLERKSMEPIALAYKGEGGVRKFANFFSRSTFDHQGMLEVYQKEIGQILSHPIGMITGDECDFPKKGKDSVGVARQYCGRVGKVDNCQASVMMGYASPEGYGLVDYALYMPKKWFGDLYASYREKCGVPQDLEFKTKNQMLSEMINRAVSAGIFKGRYVGVDSSFGNDQAFLDSLPEGLTFFADISFNRHVFVECSDMGLKENGVKMKKNAENQSLCSVSVKNIGEDPSIPWEYVLLGTGAKGPVIAQDKCLKVVESRGGKPGKHVWLYIRKLEDGSIKYSLSNESMDATPEIVRIPAIMRWSIEQCFNECKDYLGMDHYEVRSWIGWRRHILFTLIAHLFILKLRRLFSIKSDTPGPAPVIIAPVTLHEYCDALSKANNNLPIDHPNIKICPKIHNRS
jgi:SRSO17 transposase